MRLSFKFGLVVVVAACVTAGVLGVLSYRTMSDVLQEDAINTQLAASHGILNKIDDALDRARRDMRILTEDEFLKLYVTSAAQRTATNTRLLGQELADRAEYTGPWDGLEVFDRQGDKLLSAGRVRQGEGNVLDTPYATAFKRALGGETFGGLLLRRARNGEPILVFAAPIRAEEEGKPSQNGLETEDSVTGVILARYHWPAIAALLKDGFRSGDIYLFDRNGDVLASSGVHMGLQAHAHLGGHAAIQRQLTANGEAEIVHQVHHGSRAVLATHVSQRVSTYPSFGWGVAIEQPEDVIFAPARRLAWQVVFIVVSLLIVLAAAITWFGYRMMNPLARLARLAEGIGRGDFRERMQYSGHDEIGVLVSSFDSMATQLQSRERELMSARNRIQGIVDTVPDILYSAAPGDLGMTYVSPAVEGLLGYPAAAFVEEPGLRARLMLDEDRKRVLTEIHAAKRRSEDFVVTYRMRHRDGDTVLWFEDRGSWEHASGGEVVALHGLMTDITRRRQREQQLAATTRALDLLHRLDMLLTRSRGETELMHGICEELVEDERYDFAWIGILDPENPHQGLRVGAYFGGDAAVAEQLAASGFDLESSDRPCVRAVRERKLCVVQDLAHGQHPQDWAQWAQARGFLSLIGLPLISDGQLIGVFNLYSRSMARADEDELNLLAELARNLAFGLTALRTQAMHNAAREQLAHLAYHDSLTGLPNRAMFIETLRMAQAQAERGGENLAVLFVDLDDFKLVNDTLGHAAGDDLLCEVGKRIRECIRGNDLVARQGGDEFIVLMSGFGRAYAASEEKPESGLLSPGQQAQRLIERLSAPFTVDEQLTYIGASIGIAVYPHDTGDAETLLTYADSAMYRAKELGKSSYVFYSRDLTERQHHRMSVANRLHRALDRGEFRLHYQPIIELESGRLTGVEALVRWQDGETLLLPGDFLPIAEDTGLILPLGEWVLDQAFRQTRAWHEAGVPLKVAANLSARQLWRSGVADRIVEVIELTGVDSRYVELEITESAMGRDPQHMESVVQSFHTAGYSIALDDFGTGYSSLSRLKSLPIDTLKIDRTFVDGVPGDSDDDAIVVATVQLAHSLGLRSLAEGIETQAQCDWLRAQGCRYGQGFLFSRPVTAEEIADLYFREALCRDA